MKLRTFLILFVSSFVFLTMINDYITYSLTDLNSESQKVQNEMLATTTVAEDLLVANQYTTRFSRAYVATGDQKRREYYQDILDILDGRVMPPRNFSDNYWDRTSAGMADPIDRSKTGKPIEDVFLSLNISNIEFNKLKDAKAKLFELSRTEIKAMDMAQVYYSNKQQKVAPKTPKTDLQLATELLYDKNYRLLNAEIATYLSDFKSLIKKRFSDKLNGMNKRYHELMLLNAFLSAGLYLMVLASSLYLYFRIQMRGNEAILTLQRISSGNLSSRSTVKGNDEIGQLASLVNWTGSNLQEKVIETFDRFLECWRVSRASTIRPVTDVTFSMVTPIARKGVPVHCAISSNIICRITLSIKIFAVR